MGRMKMNPEEFGKSINNQTSKSKEISKVSFEEAYSICKEKTEGFSKGEISFEEVFKSIEQMVKSF